MALSITATPTKTVTDTELLGAAKLNQLAAQTFSLSGTTSAAQIGDNTITAVKGSYGPWFYCTDGGTANAHSLTAAASATTLPTSLVAGQEFAYTALNTNTGAVTVAVSGIAGTKALTKLGTVAVAAGDVRAGQLVWVRYDGTQFQMVQPVGNASVVIGTDSGSTDAYAITPTPSVRALADITGVPVIFKANTINTGNATLTIYGLAATNILKSYNVTLSDGDIKAGQWVTVVYDGTYFQLQSPVTQPSARTTVSVRQTVLGCSVNASTGLPNFLATGATTTAVYLQNCATTPLVVAFAYGHDDSGAVDYVTRCSTDGATWTGLGGTTTYYLYVDRNTSTGAITYGQTTNRPTYVTTSTVAAGAGFHTYLINTGFMYEGSATSTAIQRVFVGEATTSGGAVATVTAYMPRGQFVSGSDETLNSTAATDQNFSQTHQLGVLPRKVEWVLVCQSTDAGYAQYDEVETVNICNSAQYKLPQATPCASVTTLTIRCSFSTLGAPYLLNKGSYAITALDTSKWKLRAYAWRGW